MVSIRMNWPAPTAANLPEGSVTVDWCRRVPPRKRMALSPAPVKLANWLLAETSR